MTISCVKKMFPFWSLSDNEIWKNLISSKNWIALLWFCCFPINLLNNPRNLESRHECNPFLFLWWTYPDHSPEGMYCNYCSSRWEYSPTLTAITGCCCFFFYIFVIQIFFAVFLASPEITVAETATISAKYSHKTGSFKSRHISRTPCTHRAREIQVAVVLFITAVR